MKKIMTEWRNYQKEVLTENWRQMMQSQNLETLGDMVKFMKIIRSEGRGKEGLKAIGDYVADATGKGLVQFLYKTYVKNEPPEPQDFLKLFRIDTKIAAIVDNDVEEAFVQWFMEEVEKDTSNLAQIRLDSEEFNMNQILKRWLAGTYDGRTIDVSKAEDPT
jgi:hypothetical protein